MLESVADEKDLATLQLLKGRSGEYVSGETIRKHVRVSRAAIWKHVSTLRKYGYKIESKEGSGYKLIRSTDQLLPWEIKDGLKTKFLGDVIHHFAVIDSTQDLAIKLAENGTPEGTVVVAERQKRGRGRIGRRWSAPEGGIWMSVILRPRVATAEITILPLVAALAVCNAIRKVCGLDAKLKWPNDVLINGRKVCGILAEMSCEADRVNYVIIGMGVNANVNVRKLEAAIKHTEGYFGVTTLVKELGRTVDRIAVMKGIIKALEEVYMNLGEGSNAIIQAWKENSVTLGTTVTVASNEMCFEGRAVDIDYDGALLVKLDDGSIKRVVAGDVYVRMAEPTT